MRKITILLLGALLLLFSAVVMSARNPQVSAEGKGDWVKGEILVKFKEGVTGDEVSNVHKQLGGRVKEVIPGINVQVVAVNRGIGEAVSAYARNRNVVYAEPNYLAHALFTPNDPFFNLQWGLHNTGQTEGTPDADIDAPEAWEIATGSSTVKIAILDTGIDQDHEDLVAKIGLQKNFSDSPTLDDIYGHGTHVAGIAAADTHNDIGVAGVGFKSSLMNVKVLNDSGSGPYSKIAEGIIWAADNGAQVINLSLGARWKSATLESAVNHAWGKGAVVVAAAGNSGNPSSTYPAKYENCIAVAATNDEDLKASWSSYGDWVDVAAPGVDIYSTFPNDTYGNGSGTSMATPHVAGIAALVWSTGFGINNQLVRDRIEQTAEPILGTGSYWVWGRVNACEAVGGDCVVEPSPTPTPTPTPEPTPTPTPTPEPDCSSCFRGICDGKCHPVKDGATCPDCL